MKKQAFERGAGILCHISSLPNKYGIGSLGKEAYSFADFLAKSKVKYWQILPLVQTGYGDSPYQSVCCRSGNPYFIDLEDLATQGLLTKEELAAAEMPAGRVDYGALYQKRYQTLRTAFSRFNIKGGDFVRFEKKGEFEDYALFMSLKQVYGGTLATLPKEYKFKEEKALQAFKLQMYEKEYCFWIFLQYEFFRQWNKLKSYVNAKGIKIVGDIPLYVAYDSSDVWGKPELFELDEDLNPVSVAGVPPDYFSQTGQLWGNPIYDWQKLKQSGYEWWIQRIKGALNMYDVVRIDHFRGFDRYYKIPAGAPTAEYGEWVDGPSAELFEVAKKRLGRLNVIAEDLGVIDDGVVALREKTGFPGMKILMFAFDGNKKNEYLPQYIKENTVTYTGTHDNDTALGFINNMDDVQFEVFANSLRAALRYEGYRYPAATREQAARALCMCALGTKSQMSFIPIQDILCLDNGSRMNVPSTASGNWQFRLKEIPSADVAARLKKDIIKTGRA
ncbi:MAG: 4-alpha-glucanotransferase [Clostridia bacterium]|nr:4-alpha-glucanotransferase [Clostridia bacterium]